MSPNHISVGAPRLDPIQRLLHRFYEPLVLLRILNAARGPSEVELPVDTETQVFDRRWRRFLDDLSWLCDNKHGGESVSAVAAQQLPEGNVFWLATKSSGSLDHLRWVLEELKAVAGQADSELIEVAERIATKSIGFSRDKIKTYARYLNLRIETAKSTLQMEGTYESLFQDLDGLANLRGSHLELCHAARRFHQHDVLSRLIQSNSSIDTYSPWSAVRHYIGRLGCWFGKCYQLTLVARQYSRLLQNATCEFLALPKRSRLPCGDAKTNLKSALGRMLPATQQHRVQELYEALTSLREYNFEEVFAQNLSNDSTQTSVHAEVFLMEHFYFNNLPFVGHERYIGCSKPSCYCCSLYIRYHPGNFVMRLAHNNTYVTWCPPLLFRLDQEMERKHNLNIINQMNGYIRRDVMLEIERRFPRRERAPDSTTGLDTLSLQPDSGPYQS